MPDFPPNIAPVHLEAFLKRKRFITSLFPTGRVLWQDDFEATLLKWQGTGTGSVGRHTSWALSGEACMEIVTAATADNMMEALRQIQAHEYPLPKLGLEFRFAIPYTKFGSFIFGIEWVCADRTKWFRTGIKIPLGTWQYEDENGVWQNLTDFPAIDFADDLVLWHNAKIVVNLEEGLYDSLIVNSYRKDMRDIQAYDRLPNPVLWNVIYPYFYSVKDWTDTGTVTCLVDDVIFTAEE